LPESCDDVEGLSIIVADVQIVRSARGNNFTRDRLKAGMARTGVASLQNQLLNVTQRRFRWTRLFVSFAREHRFVDAERDFLSLARNNLKLNGVAG